MLNLVVRKETARLLKVNYRLTCLLVAVRLLLILGDRIATERHLKMLLTYPSMCIMFLHFMVELWLRNLECVIEDEILFLILEYCFNFRVKA